MIEAKDLGYSYPHSEHPVIEACNFSVDRGEILAVLGPNGSGKTTLIKVLLGLLKIQRGTVNIFGQRSYVPQETQIPFNYKVGEVVMMGASVRNGFFAVPGKADLARAENTLASVGMAEQIERGFSELSGGQKQMVLIARALVSEPDILIMDEPTSALDYRNQDRVLQCMTTTARAGKTVVFSSHCPMQALQVSHKVILIGNGSKYVSGPAQDVLNEENLSKLYQMPIGRYATLDGDVIAPKFCQNPSTH